MPLLRATTNLHEAYVWSLQIPKIAIPKNTEKLRHSKLTDRTHDMNLKPIFFICTIPIRTICKNIFDHPHASDSRR